MASFDIGIDLGTTKIMICRSDKGVVLNEPSIVAYNKKTEEVVAVGKRPTICWARPRNTLWRKSR